MRNKVIIFVSICLTVARLELTTAVTNYGRCLTPNRERAFCIELTDCQYLYNLLTDPNLSQTDRNYLTQSQCGYYQSKVLICCPERYFGSKPTATATKQPLPIPSPPADTRGSTNAAALLPKPPQCGNALNNRIVGGNVTSIDEYPWMALIEYTKPGNAKGHHCGGTLINNRYVLTAGHCVTGSAIPGDWRLSGVRLGEWDTSTNPDCEIDIRGNKDCAPEHVDIAVEERISHPQYVPNARNQVNDIALLRLARSVTFTDFVRPICLGTDANLRSSTFPGTEMDVAGWGRTESSSTSSIKLKATVTVWNLDRCQSTYTRQNIRLEATQMCAGGTEGVDSCRGDSGGPLVVQDVIANRQTYILAGVVSFGPTPCGLRDWPGVYTRVGAYIDWIQNTIRA